jgi:propionaldehyde dehydrogenase
MPINEEDLKKIIEEVVKNLESYTPEKDYSDGPIFETVDEAIKKSAQAQRYFKDLGLETRDKIISAIREASRINSKRWAEMTVAETKMGRVEDKVIKNLLVANKTPGVEDLRSLSYTGDKGLTLIEFAPFGVVAAITPSTNAVATIISNAIAILAAGNSVVFSPHPAAKNSAQDAVKIINKAIISAGGPENLVSTIATPTQESTKALLIHDKINMAIVTGGPAIVKVAMQSGKARKTIAAGPGNPPIVVDETADIKLACEQIVYGCGFDNNVLCIAEKEIILVEKIKNEFISAMRKNPYAYELSPAQIDALAKIAILEPGQEPKLNRDLVGRNPSVIAKTIGLNLPDEIRVLWSETSNDHPFVISEQLMPVLPITSAKNFDEAVELAYKLEWENHHTAGMYSMNVENLTKMARRMICSIFVKNACTLHGLGMGEGYASMSIGTPTGDGITKPTHFTRPLQCSVVGYFRIA